MANGDDPEEIKKRSEATEENTSVKEIKDMILLMCQMQIIKLRMFQKIMQNTAKILLRSYLIDVLV